VRLALIFWGGFYFILGPLSLPHDGDLYWQRWLGQIVVQTRQLPTALGRETFTAAGAPWVPQEWFFSVIVAIATNFHLFLLLALVMSAVPVAVLLLVYLRAREEAASTAIGIAVIFCGMTLTESFGVRAQVVGYGFFALFVFLLERKDRWYWATIPIAIAWANVHASVAIAPFVLGARLVAALSEGGVQHLRGNRDLALLPALLVATVCTPLGLRLPLYAISLVGSPIRHYIIEWQPPGLLDFSFLFGVLPLAIAIVAGGRATLLDRRQQSFPAALLFVASLFAIRNMPLFAIAAAPLSAFALSRLKRPLTRLNQSLQSLELVATLAIVAMLILTAGFQLKRQWREPPLLPVAAVHALGADGTNHRILCEDFAWCSVALGNPRLRVFIDGRCDPYPLQVWQAYAAAIAGGRSALSSLADYGTDTVIAHLGSALAARLGSAPSWKVAYTDGTFIVFHRE